MSRDPRPHSPGFMHGVINLRGHTVPVMNIRSKLDMPPGENTVDTCIIIEGVPSNGDSPIPGALVDSVRVVFEPPADDIEPAPESSVISSQKRVFSIQPSRHCRDS